jgi:hypothetical protein
MGSLRMVAGRRRQDRQGASVSGVSVTISQTAARTTPDGRGMPQDAPRGHERTDALAGVQNSRISAAWLAFAACASETWT